MSKNHKKLFIFFILLTGMLCAKLSDAQTLTYQVTTSDKVLHKKVEISKSDKGYLVKTSNSLNKDHSAYSTDSAFAVYKWDVQRSETGARLSVEKHHRTISVMGQLKDKHLNARLKTDDLPWCQEWSWGLKYFITSDRDTIQVWTLDSNNFEQLVKFEARKEKTEIIEINGRNIEAVYVKIRLSGFKRYLWSGDMWFRKSDGTFLYSKIKNGPTGSLVTTQLINENEMSTGK